MNINILLAGNDERYIRRLSEIMKRKIPKTGDTLKVALFTDSEKLEALFSEKKSDGKRSKYHIALIDEDVDVTSLNLSNIPVVLSLTEESDRDGGTYPLTWGVNAVNIYKYQRVSGIVDRMILEFAKKRDIDKKGNAGACAFFSPVGGCGTSTMAAAYAVAAAKAGIKPLYISFEYFNSTETFFSDSMGTNEGLYEVFCTITENGGVVATINATKNKDKSGVEFLKKFTMWTEVAQIKPSDIEVFIDAARASYEIKLVILDLGCVYTQFTEKAMECVDEIFIVADTHRISQEKINTLFSDKTFFVQDCLDKVNIIYNKSARQKYLNDFEAKSVTHIQKVSGDSSSGILDALAGALKGLIQHG